MLPVCLLSQGDQEGTHLCGSAQHVSVFTGEAVMPSASPLSPLLQETSHYPHARTEGNQCCAWQCPTEPQSPRHSGLAQARQDTHLGLSLLESLCGKEWGDTAVPHLSCLWSKPLYHSLPFSEVFELRPLSPLPPPNAFACSLRRKITWFQDCTGSCFRPWA